MNNVELTGSRKSLGLNKGNTVGAFAYQHMTDNQTRSTLYTAGELVTWAKAIEEAYGSDEPVEVVFTPNKPMIATEYVKNDGEDVPLGIGIAPLLEPDVYDEMMGEDDE